MPKKDKEVVASRPATNLEPQTNLFDYFEQQVGDAKLVVDASLSEDAIRYLTVLLVSKARMRPNLDDDTLAERHARAARNTSPEGAITYRELGDHSLYVVGFFQDSLGRQLVGPDYYCDMGSAAYQRADLLFRRYFSGAFEDVFNELSHRFRTCAELLREVRRAVDAQPDVVMRMYERWLESGSPEVARRLRRHGLVVPVGG